MKNGKAEASGEARPRRRRATATSHSDFGEKYIAGVPARIMRPRLVFIACLLAICSFGLLMVYSASAVESLQENGSSWYFLFRQGIFMLMGFVALALIVSRKVASWRSFRAFWPWILWGLVALLLGYVLVFGSGSETWGASRWIPLGSFSLQPAELAKPAVILLASKIFADHYEDATTDIPVFLLLLATCVGIPCVLIFAEPDMGTTVIIVLTVFVMWYLCGLSRWLIAGIVVVCIVAGVTAIFLSPYRLQRFMSFLDPWADPYGTGYQATLAIMAFASGGLFGRGVGNSTMKYNYLPEAHNDYILAIIGEELGFAGTIAVVAVFLCLIVAAFKIARRSPTLYGQLLASGCAIALVAQFFINACGILGIVPMTGKPLPFISYGGSSVLTSLIMAGIILRVSVESDVETAADRRRADMSVLGGRQRRTAASSADEFSTHVGRSTAGEVRPRSSRREVEMSVYDGGLTASQGRRGEMRARTGGNRADSADNGSGYGRVNLGRGAQERLRPRGSSPRVSDRGDASSGRARDAHRSGSSRGDRHGR